MIKTNSDTIIQLHFFPGFDMIEARNIIGNNWAGLLDGIGFYFGQKQLQFNARL